MVQIRLPPPLRQSRLTQVRRLLFWIINGLHPPGRVGVGSPYCLLPEEGSHKGVPLRYFCSLFPVPCSLFPLSSQPFPQNTAADRDKNQSTDNFYLILKAIAEMMADINATETEPKGNHPNHGDGEENGGL